MLKTPEEMVTLHTLVLQYALDGKTQEEIGDLVQEPPERISFLWFHGVLSPRMASIDSLLRNREVGEALAQQTQKLAALQQELALAEEERRLVVENAQQQNAMLRAKAQNEITMQQEITRNLAATAKGHAIAQLAVVSSLNEPLQEAVELIKNDLNTRVRTLKKQPSRSPAELQELMGMTKEITQLSKNVMINAHRAASVHKLLQDAAPTITNNTQVNIHNRSLEDAEKAAKLLTRNIEREKKRTGVSTIIDIPTPAGS